MQKPLLTESAMNNVRLQALARAGAETRLAALDAERVQLLKMFSDLRTEPAPPKNGSAQPAARRRPGMSPTARKAHGERMRAYWANRRAEKDGTAAASREIAADTSPTAARQAPSTTLSD
jgi:hypothetical protein